ncbi:MAG: hypothetical protein DMF39_11420 [Verrucomicrobia bacterium]|nr:MAG: hypothetical protein DMF39_11420 [Verrucomicrobiota bacterium]
MKTRIKSIVIVLTLLFLGLLPKMQAVSPAPDGCYPGFTTAEGCNALQHLATGAGNTAIGWYSLSSDTIHSYNTGVGAGTLVLNNADSNTAVGAAALLLNTSGSRNTAVGTDALVFNNSGVRNTAVGAFALYNNLDGLVNTAIGDNVLFNNTHGNYNTAIGNGLPGPALYSNTTGLFNTALGGGALSSNTEGNDNTGLGAGALAANIDGDENVAVGENALGNNTGNNNVALGNSAGFSHASGDNNIYIGYQIDHSGNESNACYIGSIFGQTASVGSAVYVTSNNKLGTVTSSKRFKDEIKPMNKASDALFALKPVTFRYKKEIDPAGISQLGLVAEDVEKVNPDLVVRDKEGKPYSVRYDQVNAMLLNEFLKEHATVLELKKEIATLTAAVREQGAQIQKVSAQIETSKPAAQAVVNNP